MRKTNNKKKKAREITIDSSSGIGTKDEGGVLVVGIMW